MKIDEKVYLESGDYWMNTEVEEFSHIKNKSAAALYDVNANNSRLNKARTLEIFNEKQQIMQIGFERIL